MARNFHKKRGVSSISELNVAPLMDLAFSLLIIFMVSAPLLEQAIDIELPKQEEKASPNPSRQDVQVINIDVNGQIYWGKQMVSPMDLDRHLAQAAQQAEQPVISLRADVNAKNGLQIYIDVIDAIKRHKLVKLQLGTQPK